jgi:hypothetical protein
VYPGISIGFRPMMVSAAVEQADATFPSTRNRTTVLLSFSIIPSNIRVSRNTLSQLTATSQQKETSPLFR